MGPVSTSAFIYRDVLRHILPAIVGVVLFAPFLRSDSTPKVGVDVLSLWVIVIAFTMSLPVLDLAERAYRRVRGRKGISDLDWWSKVWNFDELFFRLSKDEREYLYLTAAYLAVFQLISGYLALFGLISLTR